MLSGSPRYLHGIYCCYAALELPQTAPRVPSTSKTSIDAQDLQEFRLRDFPLSTPGWSASTPTRATHRSPQQSRCYLNLQDFRQARRVPFLFPSWISSCLSRSGFCFDSGLGACPWVVPSVAQTKQGCRRIFTAGWLTVMAIVCFVDRSG
jgi:hypothetical protein